MLADEENGRAVQINGKPASALRSPLQVFSRQVFIVGDSMAEHRAKLRDAIEASSP
jgi:hypothetical protein